MLIQLRRVGIANKAAERFTHQYYTVYDSPNRVDDLPKFYRPTSAISWNGNPLQGAEGVRKLIEGMPVTSHEIQSYDCHAILGR